MGAYIANCLSEQPTAVPKAGPNCGRTVLAVSRGKLQTTVSILITVTALQSLVLSCSSFSAIAALRQMESKRTCKYDRNQHF